MKAVKGQNNKKTVIVCISAIVICVTIVIAVFIIKGKGQTANTNTPGGVANDGNTEKTTYNTETWYDAAEGDEVGNDVVREIQLPEFPNVTFKASFETVEAIIKGESSNLYSGMPIWSVFFCDVTGDGYRELCSTISIGSGIIDDRIIVYDYANNVSYEIQSRSQYDYRLFSDGSNSLFVEKYQYPKDQNGTMLSIGNLWYCDGKLCITSERLQNYKIKDTWYPIVDSYRTIEYTPMRDFQTVDSAAEIVVIGKFTDDALTVKGDSDVYSTNTLQVKKVLKGEVAEDTITIGQNYYIDDEQRLIARSGMTPMEKDSEWIYFLKYDEKRKAYFAVGQAAGRYPYAKLEVEKLKREEYTMRELGLFDINEFFVYDEPVEAIYGYYSIYSEAVKEYNITFED